jgi:hypothetical protein
MLNVKKYKRLLKCNNYDEMIGVVYDLTPPEIDSLNMSEYNEYVRSLSHLKKQKNTRLETMRLDCDTTLYYKHWKYLTYGEYLDSLNYAKNDQIEYLYAIFYRAEQSPPTKLNKRTLEPYTFDIDYRAELMLNAHIDFFFTIKKDLEELDGVIQRNYKILFEDDEEVNPEEIKDGRERAMFIHNQRIKQAYNQNAWEYTTHALAGEDATKYNAVYELGLFTVLNSLKLAKALELKNNSTKK